MQIDQIPLDRLSVSKANMRQGKKPPDIADILPSVIRRGVLSPRFVRPNCQDGHYEIVAGKRRYFASIEAAKQGQDDLALPCIVIGAGDDADALEISMIENMLRQAPDPVTQWESYTRLVKEGRSVEAIAATFALTELQVKRILALGNLLPRIREAYRAEEIDAETVRHLTLATKAQQKAWLALFDGEDGYAPRGSQLKAWLFGGGAISVKAALFDMADYSGQIVTNLFEEDGYFADSDAFWAAQQAEVEKRKAQYLDDGWSAVDIVPPQAHFSTWEYEKAPKRKGGRVYIDVNHRGEVTFHEGYLTTKEAQRLRKAESDGTSGVATPKATRPELTSALASYIDLHRHAAVRAELASHSGVALRVAVAHIICGSPLWTVRVADQSNRNPAISESIETSAAETAFDERRRAILAVLGFDAESATVVQDRYGCDIVKMKIGDIVAGGVLRTRATVIQQKTNRPVQFELMTEARNTLLTWLTRRGGTLDDFIFPSRVNYMGHLSTRQYARLVDEWVGAVGLNVAEYGTHSMRRTKASLIYKATGNLRAVQILLGHTNIENTVRYLGVDIDDAITLAERTEI